VKFWGFEKTLTKAQVLAILEDPGLVADFLAHHKPQYWFSWEFVQYVFEQLVEIIDKEFFRRSRV
jgi:hypothetical protein